VQLFDVPLDPMFRILETLWKTDFVIFVLGTL